MPRLGELLVAAGQLTVEQVERALRAQVMWGGRLGTNLVELHILELDPLSQALARQHALPAALARHFEKADPELQRMLSPDFAERFSCVPLLRMGPEQHVVVAAIAPLSPRQIAILADELAVEPARIVPAIAAELRVRYQLERVYNIPRAARYLRARGKSIPPFPQFQVLPVAEPEPEPPNLPVSTREMAVFRAEAPAEATAAAPVAPAPPPPAADDLDDGWTAHDSVTDPEIPPPAPIADSWPTEPYPAVAPDAEPPASDVTETYDDLIPVEVEAPSRPTEDLDELARDAVEAAPTLVEDETSARERRQYVRTIADAPVDGGAAIGRIAIRKVALGSASRIMAGATLGEATRAIRRSTGRDRVIDLVIDTLDRFTPACDAAIVLVIRGATAIGWKGFQRTGAGLGEIAIPLESGGMVPRAVERNATMRSPASELDDLDRLLLGSLGRRDGDLVIVPISIAEQVMCVIALATPEGAEVAGAEPIAAAAGAAFARLMRDASR